MTTFSGEGKGGGAYLRGDAYFEFHIQQGRLIERGRLFEEIWYSLYAGFIPGQQTVPHYITIFQTQSFSKMVLRGGKLILDEKWKWKQ